MADRTVAVTLRKGGVFVSVELADNCTHQQWDAIGALMTQVVQAERKLNAHPGPADQP